ncbi:hypothetical protein SCAR479_04458 [Seiridium cardinale]|uniref:Uncharacterized protein n=1 Tax=Seiridium cardinale TaxID=138064 RepID=A0ABR2XYG4_9PEZI
MSGAATENFRLGLEAADGITRDTSTPEGKKTKPSIYLRHASQPVASQLPVPLVPIAPSPRRLTRAPAIWNAHTGFHLTASLKPHDQAHPTICVTLSVLD